MKYFLMFIGISLFAKEVFFSDVDWNKDRIIVETLFDKDTKQKNINLVLKQFKDLQVYVRDYQNYTAIYIVNLDLNNEYKVLKRVKRFYKDAYLIKVKRFVSKKHKYPIKTKIINFEFKEIKRINNF